MIGCREGEVHDCCLKNYGVFYFSNVWWDHIPDANCSGVKGGQCSVDAAHGGNVNGVMLIILFNILSNVMACLIILCHSRVVIRSVVTVWCRWSFLTNLAAQCSAFSKCLIGNPVNLGGSVWIPCRRGIFKFWLD